MPQTTATFSLLPKICFLLTGVSALIAEVCWIRKASLAFGSSTWAISVVLAVFFAGLAIGSFIVGRLSRKAASPLRGYAYLELGVGVATLLSPLMFTWTDALYGKLYSDVFDSTWMLALTRLVMVSLVMLPATTLMGGSLPLFCQQFVQERRLVARRIGVLYGMNTFGAAVGAAICGLWLIPNLGVNASLYLAGTVNLLVGLVALRLAHGDRAHVDATATDSGAGSDALEQGSPDAVTNPTHATIGGTERVVVVWFFFGVGFIALAAEVLWTRYLSLWLPNTVYTYTLTLSVVLFGIVLGSMLSGLIADRVRSHAMLLGAAQVIGALSVMLVMQLRPEWWGNWFNAVSPGQQLWVVALVMLTPSILSGLSFPLAISLVVSDVRLTGMQTGKMTAINLVGGILGSLLVGFVSLPYLGLQATLLIVTGLGLLLGLLAWWRLETGRSKGSRVFFSVLAIAAWLAIPAFCRTRLPQDFLGTEGTLVDFREGVNGNVSVVRKGEMLHLEINRMWQGQNVKNHQVFAAHIPALLHPSPKDVLVIGLGTGQTAKSFLVHGIERLDCLEIEDGLIELVGEHFDSDWMKDPRAHMIVEDGRNYVTHTSALYDVISIEVGQIYRPRIASFYTYDFYSRLRPRLRPEGLVCQFLPIEFFRPQEFRTLVATFLEVFPQSVLWYNRSELLLIGGVGDRFQFDPARLTNELARNEKLKRDLEYAYWGGPAYFLSRPESFVAGFLCGPAELARLGEGGDIYRDDRPYLEYLPLRPESDVSSIVALLQSHLSRFSELVGDSRTDWMTTAYKVRSENLQEITARIALARARSLEAEGDFQAAVDAYEEALKILPNYPKANASLAAFMHSQGELAGAMAFYQRSLAVNPTDPQVLLQLSDALVATGRRGEAQKRLSELLELQPDHAQANSMLGALLRLEGNFEQAEKHLRRSLAINPKQVDVLVTLAGVLLMRQQDEPARVEFEKAKELEPNSTDVYIAMGWSYGQAGRNQEAMRCFQDALAMDPKSIRALLGTANVLQSMGDARRAQQTYQDVLSIDPAVIEARLGLAISQRGEKRWDEALKNYRVVLQSMPNNPAVLSGAAWILATHPDATKRDPRQAVALAERAWEITGRQSPEAGDVLAAAYASSDQFDRAAEIAQLAIEAARRLNLNELASEIERRKSLYEQKQAYSE